MNNINTKTLVDFINSSEFPSRGVSFNGEIVGTRLKPQTNEEVDYFLEMNYGKYLLLKEGQRYCLKDGDKRIRFGIVKRAIIVAPCGRYSRPSIHLDIDLGTFGELMLGDLQEIQCE